MRNLNKKVISEVIKTLEILGFNNQESMEMIVKQFGLHPDIFLGGDFENINDFIDAVPSNIINTPMARFYCNNKKDIETVETITNNIFSGAVENGDSLIYAYIINSMICNLVSCEMFSEYGVSKMSVTFDLETFVAVSSSYKENKITMKMCFSETFKIVRMLAIENWAELCDDEITTTIKEHLLMFLSICNEAYFTKVCDEGIIINDTFIYNKIISLLFGPSDAVVDLPYISNEVLYVMFNDLLDIENYCSWIYYDRFKEIILQESEGDFEFCILTDLFSDMELLDCKLDNYKMLNLQYEDDITEEIRFKNFIEAVINID